MNFKYRTCTGAAKAGDLNELKKMHLAGCYWDKWTCSAAADNGHLECLRYAFENGCQWDADTTSYAAYNGHLECLKYAYENGCTWFSGVPKFAASNGHGHLECFKYCFEKWNSAQDFWNINFDLSKIIDKIDLNDPVWRRLFTLDLSEHPELQTKVKDKKIEIEEMKELTKEGLEDILPLDIIQYCIHPLI